MAGHTLIISRVNWRLASQRLSPVSALGRSFIPHSTLYGAQSAHGGPSPSCSSSGLIDKDTHMRKAAAHCTTSEASSSSAGAASIVTSRHITGTGAHFGSTGRCISIRSVRCAASGPGAGLRGPSSSSRSASGPSQPSSQGSQKRGSTAPASDEGLVRLAKVCVLCPPPETLAG